LILAGIAAHYHWPKAELDALTAEEAAFWHNAAAAWSERVRGDSD
jgi:hypothetical protein